MNIIQFTMPQTLGETLAWLTALAVLLVGLFIMFMPRRFMSLTGLSVTRPDGFAQMRGPFGGLLVGFALACLILSPQPLLYFALGLSLGITVLGRIISMVADGSRTTFSAGALLIEALGAFFALAYVFGLIG